MKTAKASTPAQNRHLNVSWVDLPTQPILRILCIDDGWGGLASAFGTRGARSYSHQRELTQDVIGDCENMMADGIGLGEGGRPPPFSNTTARHLEYMATLTPMLQVLFA
jgi:hypothetical protein